MAFHVFVQILLDDADDDDDDDDYDNDDEKSHQLNLLIIFRSCSLPEVISLGQRFQTSSRTVWYPPGRPPDLSQIIRMEKQPNSEKVPNPQKDKKNMPKSVVFCSVFF